MSAAIEQALAAALENGCSRIGEIAIRGNSSGGFVLTHCDDAQQAELLPVDSHVAAKFDDAGNYRPLKTAPNLRHGWRMEVVDLTALAHALDYFYPGRLSILRARNENRLTTTPLRETLDRQSGMYHIAAKISDEQIDDVVGNFCRTDGGCLRKILWRRDSSEAIPSKKLPPEKYVATSDGSIPLLCQEACNLLVNECRKAVKAE